MCLERVKISTFFPAPGSNKKNEVLLNLGGGGGAGGGGGGV